MSSTRDFSHHDNILCSKVSIVSRDSQTRRYRVRVSCSFLAAHDRGVWPTLSFTMTSTLLVSSNSWTTSWCPLSIANDSGVRLSLDFESIESRDQPKKLIALMDTTRTLKRITLGKCPLTVLNVLMIVSWTRYPSIITQRPWTPNLWLARHVSVCQRIQWVPRSQDWY